jgi:aspartyl-tRNA(Asn)/glutamyl-tRNA(Gln) amidotransferase subunit A
MHELLKTKKASSVEITNSVIGRIDDVDATIGSFLSSTFDSALDTAKTVDEKIARNEKIAPLAGIPMAVKDNMCTKGVKTTCASRMLENYIPMYDADVVAKLKKADVPILGKVNMDEFAMGSSTETSYFKKTRNPHNIERIPGGSSGGSAAAVCADEAVYALGSDTGGSIRQPSSHCGVVGLKPTYGVVSRFGLVAFASSLDQIGPITKNVADCAKVMDLIAGHDEKDSTSFNIDYPNYSANLIPDAKGLKIGVPREYMGKGISEDVSAVIKNVIKQYEDMGAIVEETSLPLTDYYLAAYYIIACAEASSNLARYDGIKYGYRTKDFSDLTDLYKKTRSEGFGDEVKRRIILGTYVLSSGYYDAYYKKAQQVRTIIRNGFSDELDKYDLLLTPVTPDVAFKFGEKSSDPITMYLEDICTVSINIAGVPAISVPCGVNRENLPIGVQLIGKHFGEPTLLRAAYAFEQSGFFTPQKPQIKSVKGSK